MKRIVLHLLACILLVGCQRAPTPSETYWIGKGDNSSDTLVVFVHGILGNSKGTWENPADRENGWPDLLVSDPRMSGLTALSFGYYSSKLDGAANIEELAERLIGELGDKKVFERYRKIVFLAHSMGGLVVKQALLKLALTNVDALQRVKLVVFLATPSYGVNIAQWASWISGNPQFGDMKPADFNTFLQSVENNWNDVRRKRTDSAPFPRSFCAYEELDTGPVKVVPRSASERNCDENPRSFTKDHITIAKPLSRDDPVYEYVLAKLKDTLGLSQYVADCVQRPLSQNFNEVKRHILELHYKLESRAVPSATEDIENMVTNGVALAKQLEAFDEADLPIVDRVIRSDHLAAAYSAAALVRLKLVQGHEAEAIDLAKSAVAASTRSVTLFDTSLRLPKCKDFQDWIALKRPSSCLQWRKVVALSLLYTAQATPELEDELSTALRAMSCSSIDSQSQPFADIVTSALNSLPRSAGTCRSESPTEETLICGATNETQAAK